MMFALWLVANAWGGTLAGVALPDTVEVGGQILQLNGMGLLEKLGFDIYVGALYLPQRTADPERVLGSDIPRRFVMHFTFPLPASRIRSAIRNGFATVSASRTPQMRSKIDRFLSWVTERSAPGSELVVDYIPGQGTTLFVDGERRGTIPGAEFAHILSAVFIGHDPPSQALKQGLLGG